MNDRQLAKCYLFSIVAMNILTTNSTIGIYKLRYTYYLLLIFRISCMKLCTYFVCELYPINKRFAKSSSSQHLSDYQVYCLLTSCLYLYTYLLIIFLLRKKVKCIRQLMYFFFNLFRYIINMLNEEWNIYYIIYSCKSLVRAASSKTNFLNIIRILLIGVQENASVYEAYRFTYLSSWQKNYNYNNKRDFFFIVFDVEV